MTDIIFTSVPADQRARCSAAMAGAGRDARRLLGATARIAARLVGLAVFAGAVWYGAHGLWSLVLQLADIAQDLLRAAWSVMTAAAGLGAPH